MREQIPASKQTWHTSPAFRLATWITGVSATTWGCLGILIAYPVFTNTVIFIGALSGNSDLAIWSLVKAVSWGSLWLAIVWAFRFKYRRECNARLAESAQAAVATGDADFASKVTGVRTLAHILLHLLWVFFSSVGSLAYLSGASSNADVNVWGLRVLTLMTLGLIGSMQIHLSWWGRQHWISVRFWVSWWVVTLAAILLGVPVAMMLVPL